MHIHHCSYHAGDRYPGAQKIQFSKAVQQCKLFFLQNTLNRLRYPDFDRILQLFPSVHTPMHGWYRGGEWGCNHCILKYFSIESIYYLIFTYSDLNTFCKTCCEFLIMIDFDWNLIDNFIDVDCCWLKNVSQPSIKAFGSERKCDLV